MDKTGRYSQIPLSHILLTTYITHSGVYSLV